MKQSTNYGACVDTPIIRHHEYLPHHGVDRAYMRDFILGVNDGIISMMLLTSGIFAGGVSLHTIRLSIMSGAVAGMISMGFGEYLATKSQEEVLKGELDLEKKHIDAHLDVELEQARCFLRDTFGIKNQTIIESFVGELAQDKNALFLFMKSVEFGASESDNRNPFVAMGVSGSLFFIGSIPSVLAFTVAETATTCFIVCVLLNILTLFAVGCLKTFYTRGNVWCSGIENMCIGIVGTFTAYGVGILFDSTTRHV